MVNDVKSEDGFYVGKNFIFKEDTIITVITNGQPSQTIIDDILNIIEGYMRKDERQLSILADLDKAGKPDKYTREKTREITKISGIHKLVLYGTHPVAKVVGAFLTFFNDPGKVRFFSNKAAALTWLNEA